VGSLGFFQFVPGVVDQVDGIPASGFVPKGLRRDKPGPRAAPP